MSLFSQPQKYGNDGAYNRWEWWPTQRSWLTVESAVLWASWATLPAHTCTCMHTHRDHRTLISTTEVNLLTTNSLSEIFRKSGSSPIRDSVTVPQPVSHYAPQRIQETFQVKYDCYWNKPTKKYIPWSAWKFCHIFMYFLAEGIR